MSLAGKNAIVTGGASGIGRAVSLRLAKDGANVAIFDLDGEGGRKVARELNVYGRASLAVEVDVARFDNVAAGVEEVRRHFGPVSILVNNAGIGEIVPLLQMTEAQWDRMVAVHLKGTFNCTRVVAADMVAAGWGRVISTASVAGLGGAAGFVHYSAGKAGIIGFTKALAQELGPTGVTVNAIAPGLIDTPILRKAALTDDVIDAIVRRSPLRRKGLPEDIAACCAYIASEESGFLTGQVLSPNGGTYL